jgi:hypothetical protein
MQLLLRLSFEDFLRTLHALDAVIPVTVVSAVDPMFKGLPANLAPIDHLNKFILTVIWMFGFDVIGGVNGAIK